MPYPQRLTAAVTPENGGYVAQCIELDVASQGDTAEEALINLKEALELYFEDGPNADAPQSPIITLDEERLPHDVLRLATRRGDEWAWPMQRVPTAIAAARKLGLATLGGQIQFRCPQATYELYWRNADASPQAPDESWVEYVSRSADEVLTAFRRLPHSVEELEADIHRWPSLAEQYRAGVTLSQFLCFVLYFVERGTRSADAPAIRLFRS